jgi:hypothetical protein
MNWKGCGGTWSWPNLRYYNSICLEGLRKTTQTLRQESQSLRQDLNMGPPEYEAGLPCYEKYKSHIQTSTHWILMGMVLLSTDYNKYC